MQVLIFQQVVRQQQVNARAVVREVDSCQFFDLFNPLDERGAVDEHAGRGFRHVVAGVQKCVEALVELGSVLFVVAEEDIEGRVAHGVRRKVGRALPAHIVERIIVKIVIPQMRVNRQTDLHRKLRLPVGAVCARKVAETAADACSQQIFPDKMRKLPFKVRLGSAPVDEQDGSLLEGHCDDMRPHVLELRAQIVRVDLLLVAVGRGEGCEAVGIGLGPAEGGKLGLPEIVFRRLPV